MPRVAIVADSPVVRAGLATLLGAESTLVVVDAPAPDERQSVGRSSIQELAASAAPDVVIWAPGRLDGDAVLDLYDDSTEADAPHLPVVLLADVDDEASARRALRSGVVALLPSHAEGTQIVAAIHAAAAGLAALPAALVYELLRSAAPVDGAPVRREPIPVPLTPREREVLALLAEGRANKVIASQLDITEHTVKAHVAGIYHKLGAGNRAEAVLAAARQGLILL